MASYKSSRDYDANFIKVHVVTDWPLFASSGSLYVTNLPGPYIRSIQNNSTERWCANDFCYTQLSQSPYSILQLPYLARLPNFILALSVGLRGGSRELTQITPNFQMFMVQKWTTDPHLGSFVAALTGFLLAVVVTILHCRERRADKLEHLTVKNRFRHVKLPPYAFVWYICKCRLVKLKIHDSFFTP